MEKYAHAKVEHAAQKKWAELDLYRVDLSDGAKDPYYLLVEFPYPSGDLHIGHWYAFAVTDIYARMLRARGKNVLFPIGFDAFGLPAENAAMKHGADPRKWTYENIERMRTQLASMGASFDWDKEVLTCEPSYYQWTQWLFTKLFEHGLAERREAPVKWCPKDRTVLANEQVIDGRCERCGTEVEEKRLTQWFLKITDYAERLLAGLDALPWREEIKEAQRAWIGKSEGAHIAFPIAGREESIRIFTTRPDTIFGATYVVLAPEHPLVSALPLSNKEEVDAYVSATAKKTERERSENKDKTGVKLEGVSAVNPATKEEIPIYVADYVLSSYGTGAVMAVPAHDERDFEFAKKTGLPARQVVAPETGVKHENESKRSGGCAIIFDPDTQRYAALKRRNTYLGLCAGGVQEGEDPTTAILREVAEEAGFHDFVHVEIIGEAVPHYFNSVKKIHVTGDATALLLILKSTAARERKLEAHEDFETVWVTAKELRNNWLKNDAKSAEHWLWFLSQGVGRAIELGYDTTSDPSVFMRGAYAGSGILVNSGTFSGRSSEESKWDIVAAVGGERATNYRIRDWLVSRQRYWGCPMPIVYDPEGKPHAVPAEHLPWLLPTDVDFKPTGKAPLASSKELQERVTKLFGEGWTPEYDTLDTFVDSSWYFLRYLDPKDAHDFSDAALMKKWLPVNRYSGGSEHTTMHVLYARFFMKALYDLALVPVEEPFTERFNRGLIMGPDGQKMSKSKGNVINPDEFVRKYGADAVRLYLAFIGPYNEPGNYPWNLEGVASMRKFLERVARMVGRATEGGTQVDMGITAEKVRNDGDRFKFNTAVAALMSLLNTCEEEQSVSLRSAKEYAVMLAPFAPHLAEHLWEKLGGEAKTAEGGSPDGTFRGSVHQQAWPESGSEAKSESEVVVQVNGKRRGAITLSKDASDEAARAAALGLSAVTAALGGKEPARVVYVPGKIINFVV